MTDIEIVEIEERQLPRRPRADDSATAYAPNPSRARSAAWNVNSAPASDSGSRRAPASLAGVALILTVLLAALSAAVALLAWHSRARTVTTTRTVPARVAATVDAIGCPVTATCDVSALPLPDSLAAIRSWNAGAVMYSGMVVFDERRTPLRSLITVEVAARNATPTRIAISRGPSSFTRVPPSVAAVTIASQCVPHGARVPNSVRTDARSTVISVTVGGRPGCSVVVTGALPATTLSRLAHAPELQL